eukprot:scaffold564_cov64-Phaeocystis_antarctica.AAC.3
MVRMAHACADTPTYFTFSGLLGRRHGSCGLRHGSPEAADQYVTNMLGGARPGPRATFYASCVRTLPSLPNHRAEGIAPGRARLRAPHGSISGIGEAGARQGHLVRRRHAARYAAAATQGQRRKVSRMRRLARVRIRVRGAWLGLG